MFPKKILVLLSLCLLGSGSAWSTTLQFEDVLQLVFERNLDLKASNLQVKMRTAERMQIEGALDTRYGGSFGLNDETKPTTNPYSPSGTSTSFISGDIVKPFSDGSTLTGTINYNKVELAYPSSSNLALQANPNPIYQHQIDLIYRYPLASGAGNPDYHYQAEAGDYSMKAAELSVAMMKEQLASQTITLYAQFILNDLSVEIAEDATLRAKQLLNNQKNRESFGLIEKEDRLQTEALLAARKLQQMQAVAARDAAQTALNRLMFQDADTAIAPTLSVAPSRLRPVASMLGSAEQLRPVFKMLDAQYAAAQARLRMAEAAGDYQLDLVGQVGTRALDGSSGTAFSQGFTLQDRYIGLRLDFSDVLDNQSNRYAIQRSVLDLENIKIERQKILEDLETELASIHATLRSGKLTLKASAQQVAAEKRKYNAELARYNKGRSTTAVITQFEGDLRTAELRYLVQQVSMSMAEYQLLLASGELPALSMRAVGEEK